MPEYNSVKRLPRVPSSPDGDTRGLRAYFTQRLDPATSLLLVLPLFLAYQLGVLWKMRCGSAGCAWEGNGVDFLTANLLAATHGSRLAYGLTTLVVTLVLGFAVYWARQQGRMRLRALRPY